MIKRLLRLGARVLQWLGWILVSVAILLLMPG